MRKITMTQQAIEATKTRLSSGENFIPSLFGIEGDKKSGYTIKILDSELCGFDLICLRSLYAVKFVCSQINETGKTDYEQYCTTGSFAWREHNFNQTNN